MEITPFTNRCVKCGMVVITDDQFNEDFVCEECEKREEVVCGFRNFKV